MIGVQPRAKALIDSQAAAGSCAQRACWTDPIEEFSSIFRTRRDGCSKRALELTAGQHRDTSFHLPIVPLSDVCRVVLLAVHLAATDWLALPSLWWHCGGCCRCVAVAVTCRCRCRTHQRALAVGSCVAMRCAAMRHMCTVGHGPAAQQRPAAAAQRETRHGTPRPPLAARCVLPPSLPPRTWLTRLVHWCVDMMCHRDATVH